MCSPSLVMNISQILHSFVFSLNRLTFGWLRPNHSFWNQYPLWGESVHLLSLTLSSMPTLSPLLLILHKTLDECTVNNIILYDQNGDENYADDTSRPPTSIFSWPPPPEDDNRNTPTAAQLYIPPPGTQHVKPKTYQNDEADPVPNSVQVENVIDMVPASWLTQQSRSAPELTAVNLKEHNELTESYTDSYPSTSTTTTTTSDEYSHRMYNAQSIVTQSQCYYDQSSFDLNSSYDYEVASFQHQLEQYHSQNQSQQQLQLQQKHGSFSSASTDLMSFNAGRRSAQECVDSLYHTVDTNQLVDYIRSVTPNPTENQAFVSMPRLTKKVEFADTVKAVNAEDMIQSVDLPSEAVEPTVCKSAPVQVTEVPPFDTQPRVTSTATMDKFNVVAPKEWTSAMLRALTTASPKPFQIPDVPVLSDCGNCSTEFPAAFDCSSCPIECQQKCKESARTCDEVDIEDTCAPTEVARKDSIPSATLDEAKLFPWESLESKKPPIKTIRAPTPSSLDTAKVFGEAVAMPDQSAPYFPPPISMEPIERLEPKGTRSPFCEALTVAPLQSFTPFENDVISQIEGFPRPQEQIKFVDALTTAPNDPVQKLNADLPDETDFERSERIDSERQQVQAAEVRKIIEATVGEQMSKRTSAFAALRGFRSVDPFKPMQSALLPSLKNRSRSSSIVRTDDRTQSNACPNESSQNQNNSNSSSSAAARPSSASSKRSVAFPPPASTPAKSYIQSGLQNPKTIPKYQRQWFNLPSQSPIRTPEPPELRENVPLAFIDVPLEQTDQISKPLAVTFSAAATSIVATNASHHASSVTKTTSSSSEVSKLSTKEATVVPSLNEKRTGPITMTFQTIDEKQLNEPPRSTTPSLINKPAALIPFYQHQQNLISEYYEPTTGHLFDPYVRTPSPRPDSAKSPAPGPPPNPLKIKTPHVGVVGKPSIITGESAQKCQINSTQSLATAQLVSGAKSFNQVATQSFQSTPTTVCREQCGNQSIETHSQSSELNRTQKTNSQCSSTVQIGNTQIERNRRVVTEYEHTQKAKAVEIHTTSNGQQQTNTQHAYGKGFVARTARRLSETPLTARNAIVSYRFPHITSPVTESGFPIKTPPPDVSFDVVQKESFPPPVVVPLSSQIQNISATANGQCTKNQSAQASSSISSFAAQSNPLNTFAPVDKPLQTVANIVSAAAKCNQLSASDPIANNQNQNTVVSDPSHASAGPNKDAGWHVSATTAPKRGRGVLNNCIAPGARVPQCGSCNAHIRWRDGWW